MAYTLGNIHEAHLLLRSRNHLDAELVAVERRERGAHGDAKVKVVVGERSSRQRIQKRDGFALVFVQHLQHTDTSRQDAPTLCYDTLGVGGREYPRGWRMHRRFHGVDYIEADPLHVPTRATGGAEYCT